MTTLLTLHNALNLWVFVTSTLAVWAVAHRLVDLELGVRRAAALRPNSGAAKMNRRNFFKVLFGALAAVALPVRAKPAPEPMLFGSYESFRWIESPGFAGFRAREKWRTAYRRWRVAGKPPMGPAEIFAN